MNAIKTLKPHVSLNVKNLEASIKFYQKLFSIEPAFGWVTQSSTLKACVESGIE